MKLRPFWPYYGGKWRIAPRYPSPRFDTIVEPFAGAAGYATRHHAARVLLVDSDPVIAGVWSYLIRTPATEILALPTSVEHVDDLHAPQEARWLVGFWLNGAGSRPGRVPSAWARSGIRPGSFWGERARARIAAQVEAIRHWRIVCGDWRVASGLVPAGGHATWFVDPPYVGTPGRHYRHHRVDFDALGAWCRTLPGLVIACENEGAAWLPFRPFVSAKATPSRFRMRTRSAEAVWTSDDAEALAA